jgi:hypothetical protein
MIGLIVRASLEKSVIVIFEQLLAERWGVVTLIDLYAGFAFVILWIGVCERKWTRTLAWTIAIMGLGNLATLAYIALRCRKAAHLEQIVVPRWVVESHRRAHSGRTASGIGKSDA